MKDFQKEMMDHWSKIEKFAKPKKKARKTTKRKPAKKATKKTARKTAKKATKKTAKKTTRKKK